MVDFANTRNVIRLVTPVARIRIWRQIFALEDKMAGYM
jgi:hypothetical protein